MICVLLVGIAAVLSMTLLSRYVNRTGGVGSAIGGAVATVLAVASAGVLALNIQATAVPLMALLPLVPQESNDPAVDQSLTQLRAALAAGKTPVGHEAVAQAIVNQAWQYTALNTATMGVITMVLGVMGIALLVRFVRSKGDRRLRATCAAVGPLLLVSALGFLAVSALSLLSAYDASSTAAGMLGG